MDNGFKMTKFQVSIMMILCLVLSVTGATFAYLTFSASNNVTINGDAATVNLTLMVDKMFPTSTSNNTGVIVPQLSVSGSNNSPLSTALKNGCIDANGNIVCQVYKIVVKNDGGTATQIVDGVVSFYSDANMTTDASVNIPNLRWKLIDSVDVVTPSNSVLGVEDDKVANFNENLFVDDIIMASNVEKTYYMIIWINETSDEQVIDAGKTFYGNIEFKSSNGTGVTSLFSA